jgi:hypothetical protein
MIMKCLEILGIKYNRIYVMPKMSVKMTQVGKLMKLPRPRYS